ncbi:MAG: hypothetical protein HZB65_00465 [Candidatus Aenigmarchaeota archaeon]|nr:hypothetical protein [Candidatus Aenigmarchaeota archaeon]
MTNRMSRREFNNCLTRTLLGLTGLGVLFSSTECGGGGGGGNSGPAGGAVPQSTPEPIINDKQQALALAIDELTKPEYRITATQNTSTWINLQYQGKDVMIFPEYRLSQINGIDAWLKTELFTEDVNTNIPEPGYTTDELATKNRAMADPNIYRNVVKIFSVRPGMTGSGIRLDVVFQVGVYSQQLTGNETPSQKGSVGYEKIEDTHKPSGMPMVIYRTLSKVSK